MKKATQYEPVRPEFIRTEMIALDKLEAHPDAAAFWGLHREKDEEEDSAALVNDIREHGLLEPLMVSLKFSSTDEYWVLDGCGRLKAARYAGLEVVACSIYEIDIDKVRHIALSKNAFRRRITAGERIMRYIDLHCDAILKTWKADQNPAATGARGKHNGEGSSRDYPSPAKGESHDPVFSAGVIAARLGCSRKDVSKGIELAAARIEGGLPKRLTDGRTVIIPADDPAVSDHINRTYLDVMGGRTPIRRWAAALKGRSATEGTERAATDYGGIVLRAATALRRTFEVEDDVIWCREITQETREKILKELDAALRSAPMDVWNLLKTIMETDELQKAGKSKGRRK